MQKGERSRDVYRQKDQFEEQAERASCPPDGGFAQSKIVKRKREQGEEDGSKAIGKKNEHPVGLNLAETPGLTVECDRDAAKADYSHA